MTRTNLVSQSYANIYNILDNRDNIPDPRGDRRRGFVYTRSPLDSANFAKNGYPFMILKKPTPEIKKFVLDNKNLNSLV